MINRRSILVAVLLAAFTVAGVYARSYDFKLDQPVSAGNVQLPPGAYRMEVKDGTAILTNAKGKGIKIPMKVTKTDAKFQGTAVNTDTSVTPPQLKSIGLGGSTTQVEFAN